MGVIRSNTLTFNSRSTQPLPPRTDQTQIIPVEVWRQYLAVVYANFQHKFLCTYLEILHHQIPLKIESYPFMIEFGQQVTLLYNYPSVFPHVGNCRDTALPTNYCAPIHSTPGITIYLWSLRCLCHLSIPFHGTRGCIFPILSAYMQFRPLISVDSFYRLDLPRPQQHNRCCAILTSQECVRFNYCSMWHFISIYDHFLPASFALFFDSRHTPSPS